MTPASSVAAEPIHASDSRQKRTSPYTPGLSDGLGDRFLAFDRSSGTSLELLRFKREFSDAPGFQAWLRKRVEEVGRLRHPSIAGVRSVEWLGNGEGLALVSTHIAGRR